MSSNAEKTIRKSIINAGKFVINILEFGMIHFPPNFPFLRHKKGLKFLVVVKHKKRLKIPFSIFRICKLNETIGVIAVNDMSF